MKNSIQIILFLFLCNQGVSQCTNTFKFPFFDAKASMYNDTVLIALSNYAGDYFNVIGLDEGETYEVASSAAADYFTLRDIYDPTILFSHGPSPYTFTTNTQDKMAFHLSLAAPSCGQEAVFRTTSIVCLTCEEEPPTVGIETTTPRASLEVDGEILVGDSGRSPEAGMIRWNESAEDFEGYNGEKWISFTSPNGASWGSVSNATLNENLKIGSSGNDASGNFGTSVAIGENYAIVGAPQFDEFFGPTAIGDAYIFKREGTNWVQIQKISASDGAPNDEFGGSVAISGDFIAIGAPFADIGSNNLQGAVYIFKRSFDTWTETAKLTASDGQAGDRFGARVSLDETKLCVGVPQAFANNNGAAYIFDRSGSTWTETIKFSAGGSFTNFGASVDLRDNYAIIGAPGAFVSPNSNQGRAYIYEFNGTSWNSGVNITAPDGNASDYFGSAVAIDYPYLVVGAPYRDVGSNTNQGMAYVFNYSEDEWNFVDDLVASEGDQYVFFGDAVGIEGEEVVVGAPDSDEEGNINRGAAYLFDIVSDSKVSQKSKILASDGGNNHRLGSSIAMKESFIFIGARLASGPVLSSGGAVYILSKN